MLLTEGSEPVCHILKKGCFQTQSSSIYLLITCRSNKIKIKVKDNVTDHSIRSKGNYNEYLMSKTASVRFYRSSKNRVSFQHGVV